MLRSGLWRGCIFPFVQLDIGSPNIKRIDYRLLALIVSILSCRLPDVYIFDGEFTLFGSESQRQCFFEKLIVAKNLYSGSPALKLSHRSDERHRIQQKQIHPHPPFFVSSNLSVLFSLSVKKLPSISSSPLR
jgi:hypothetical protein